MSGQHNGRAGAITEIVAKALGKTAAIYGEDLVCGPMAAADLAWIG